jgi:hypothetical protein
MHRKLIALAAVGATLIVPAASFAQSAHAGQSSVAPASSTARAGQHPKLDVKSIAKALGKDARVVRKAFRDNRPPMNGTRPTTAQVIAAISGAAAELDVSPDTLMSLVLQFGGRAVAAANR